MIFRMRTVIAATALAAMSALMTSARQTPAPTTTPAVNGWFGVAPSTTPAAEIDGEAAIFARLYPELARADKAVRAATPRLLFDALGAKGKPPLKIAPLYCPGGAFTDASVRASRQVKPPDLSKLVPDERRARIWAVEARQRAASLCLDIEDFSLDTRYASPADVDRAVRVLAKTVGWAHAQDPNLRLFFYGGFPAGENYVGPHRFRVATAPSNGSDEAARQASAAQFEKERDAWRAANARLGRPVVGDASEPRTPFADLFDATCPSIYLHNIPELLERSTIPGFVRETVNEARRYGKPVYPFVWYLLCDTNIPVPLPLWTTQMREVMTYADGAVLWDGPTVWNNRLALRVRIAMLLAERQGAMTDEEIYAAVRSDFPGDSEIEVLHGAATTQQSR